MLLIRHKVRLYLSCKVLLIRHLKTKFTTHNNNTPLTSKSWLLIVRRTSIVNGKISVLVYSVECLHVCYFRKIFVPQQKVTNRIFPLASPHSSRFVFRFFFFVHLFLSFFFFCVLESQNQSNGALKCQLACTNCGPTKKQPRLHYGSLPPGFNQFGPYKCNQYINLENMQRKT